MVHKVWFETRRAVRNLGTVSGLRASTDLPVSLIRDAGVRARWLRRQQYLQG